ncbi:hypothetical protein ACFOWZ_30295 [Lentzea rhizosphaerae]|uniref:NusG domain-containing protein n=1 Tax=Lentzea rhizosphaerae TaxID=2041025 RepID=A0ABV8C1D4_9PSEU
MPEWMRSQFMAPAYALLISLAVALVLGFSMNQQAPQEPDPVKVQLKVVKTLKAGTISNPATELVGTAVTIQSGKPLTVGADGAVTGPAVADGSLTVCVHLSDKWVGVDATGGTLHSPCWVKPADKPIELKVKEG